MKMIVIYNEYYYEIILNEEEITQTNSNKNKMLTNINNYTYQNKIFIPLIIFSAKLEVMEGEAVNNKGLKSLVTGTYPFYLTESNYHISWNGCIEPITNTSHNLVKLTNKVFKQQNIENFICFTPGDTIIHQNGNLKINKPFVYEYNFKTGELILHSYAKEVQNK